jgi:hypothetical protein
MTEDRERQLIAAARAVLSGDLRVPLGRETRSSALLARTALEMAVNRLVSDLSGMPIESTNMRHQLICLRHLPDGDQQTTAGWAFAGLSSACHEHAYDLPPTHQEMLDLIDAVAQLLSPRED